MTIEQLRNSFPSLRLTVYGRPLVYLDNAATSLRPDSVIAKWTEMSVEKNANIHRAVHRKASEATLEYETTRDVVKDFIGASDRSEVIFTSGTTGSINLLAYSFGEAFIREGDEILIAESEHHSDIVPWQIMAARKGAVVRSFPIEDNGEIDPQRLRENLTKNTKLVCCAEISNVLGVKNPMKELVNICHSAGCLFFADGAQGVVHNFGCDVVGNDYDFYAFSGHKLFAATGTGVFYGKKELLEKMPPYMGGGEMIDRVSFSKTTYAPLPGKFEAGTQNIASVPTLKDAISLAQESKTSSEIEKEQRLIVDYLLDYFGSKPGIKLYGKPTDPANKIPLFSFRVEQVHHEDLALILDKMGLALRSGQMCAEPLMDRFGVTGMLRASFAPYNTLAEAEYFTKSLEKAIKMLI